MSQVLNFIASFIKTIGQGLLIIWNLVKWIFGKCWKFILLFGSIFLALFSIKKATKED